MRYPELVPVMLTIIGGAAEATDMLNIFWITECRARQQESLVNFYCNLSTYQIKGNTIFLKFFIVIS